jgi:glutamine amidotransferase-like uncharacterized protein
MDKAWPNSGFTVLATYATEIAINYPSITKGQMVNTPAIVTSTVGAGRVLLSSPHPEMTTPMLYDLIKAYILWTGRAI